MIGAVAVEAAARVVAIEAVHGAQGARDHIVGSGSALRACKLLCERSSGMSFICAVERAGCIVWIGWVKAGLIGQPCCGEGRVPTLVVERLGSRSLRSMGRGRTERVRHTGGRAETARHRPQGPGEPARASATVWR